MPKLCHWCESYYCRPTPRYQSLCSLCDKLYRTGKYRHPRLLRPLPHRSQKTTFRHAPPLPGIRIDSLSLSYPSSPIAIKVKDLAYHPEKSNVIRLLTKLSTNATTAQIATPAQVWALLAEMEIWLTAEEANQCLRNYRTRDQAWRFEHAIGSRVIDWWNLTLNNHGVAACYYVKSEGHYPRSLADITYPSGQPGLSFNECFGNPL